MVRAQDVYLFVLLFPNLKAFFKCCTEGSHEDKGKVSIQDPPGTGRNDGCMLERSALRLHRAITTVPPQSRLPWKAAGAPLTGHTQGGKQPAEDKLRESLFQEDGSRLHLR